MRSAFGAGYTDIVFLIILFSYWFLLLQTIENRFFAPNLQLPITFFTITNNDSICKEPLSLC
jgi:hypothetical protein